ncbi:BRD4-interacting chromatin-remodeling complex-associated protein-like [Equus quagga]|uniref:BRD4-interacting chromatin-remodeling complex-associated protein-like n=1 Tax=Equus quagga TaxID=89248 RepID=UPI001EE1BF31|nr:BRD4-interacting chromatin-remodeling complex-associated protein-like [Equus quagga]
MRLQHFSRQERGGRAAPATSAPSPRSTSFPRALAPPVPPSAGRSVPDLRPSPAARDAGKTRVWSPPWKVRGRREWMLCLPTTGSRGGKSPILAPKALGIWSHYCPPVPPSPTTTVEAVTRRPEFESCLCRRLSVGLQPALPSSETSRPKGAENKGCLLTGAPGPAWGQATGRLALLPPAWGSHGFRPGALFPSPAPADPRRLCAVRQARVPASRPSGLIPCHLCPPPHLVPLATLLLPGALGHSPHRRAGPSSAGAGCRPPSPRLSHKALLEVALGAYLQGHPFTFVFKYLITVSWWHILGQNFRMLAIWR